MLRLLASKNVFQQPANAIFLSAPTRFASPASNFLFHSVGFNMSAGQRLEAKNLRELLGSVTADHRRISTILADRTKITVEEGDGLFAEQKTFDAKWALDKGVIGEIRDFSVPAGREVQLIAQ
ncbi:MAG TPA: hypothetical protein VMV19_16695 [Xanthobacteraceae bacterium]|nr:hypothetical protein [Xanthobacteraceae bacterium]